MYGNLFIYAIIKYHFDRKLSNKIAQCSVAGSRGLNAPLPLTSLRLSSFSWCGYLWLPGAFRLQNGHLCNLCCFLAWIWACVSTGLHLSPILWLKTRHFLLVRMRNSCYFWLWLERYPDELSPAGEVSQAITEIVGLALLIAYLSSFTILPWRGFWQCFQLLLSHSQLVV